MSSSVAPLRVLLADDHPVVRRGIAALLSTLEGVELVGEASTGAEAIREAVLVRPSVVVMDVRMPDMDGVEATRRLAAAAPECAVLMLTMFDDDETVFAAMRAGARGYLLKGAAQEDILQAIRSVAAGHVVLGPGVAQRLLDHLPRRRRRPRRRLRSLNSPRASARYSTSSPPGGTTPRSRRNSGLRRRPSSTTSRRSSPSFGWRVAPRRSCGRARRVSGGRRPDHETVSAPAAGSAERRPA